MHITQIFLAIEEVEAAYGPVERAEAMRHIDFDGSLAAKHPAAYLANLDCSRGEPLMASEPRLWWRARRFKN